MSAETNCLAHGEDGKPNGCDMADQCQRHLALRAVGPFPGGNVEERACTKSGYPAFVRDVSAKQN